MPLMECMGDDVDKVEFLHGRVRHRRHLCLSTGYGIDMRLRGTSRIALLCGWDLKMRTASHDIAEPYGYLILWLPGSVV